MFDLRFHMLNRGLKAPRRLRSSGFLAIAFVAAAAIGCSKPAPLQAPVFPVKGTITFKGQPIQGAVVVLHPKAQGPIPAPTPRANVDAQGNFAVTTYASGDGAPEGEYTVTVQWYKPVKGEGGDLKAGPNVIPAKYSRPAQSDLKIVVATGPNEVPPIKL